MASSAVTLAVVPAAQAAVLTAWDSNTGTLTITLNAQGDRAALVREGTDVSVNDSSSLADLADLNHVVFAGSPSAAVEAVIDLGGGRFTRAAPAAPIDFKVDLGTDLGDTLRVLGEFGYDNIQLGTEKLNLSAQGAVSTLVTATGVDTLDPRGPRRTGLP